MRRALAATAALLLLSATPSWAVDYPQPDGFVVDTAEVLDAPAEERLETELADYATQTTNQVAVAVVPSLQGQSVEDFAQGLFDAWGVGVAGQDNGVLLLVAVDDRADRVQVGRGLESVLTDAAAADVLSEVNAGLARGDYAGGVEAGVTAVRRLLGDSAPAADAPVDAPPVDGHDPFGGGTSAPVQRSTGPHVPVGLVLVVGFFLLTALAGRGRRRRGYGRGGIGSSFGSGLLFGSLLNSGRGGGFGGGGGGWGSGGGGGSWGGGGGGSWGGGGGFGGGMSGGGGASGGW